LNHADFFRKNFQVVTLDVRGHGQSGKPPGPYSVPLFAADTVRLMEAVDIAPAHVVGISMGGMIAFQLAVDRPDLIKSMVIVNSSPELVPRTFKERLLIMQRFAIVRLLGMRKMGEVLSKRLFIKPEQEELRQQLVERWAENDPQAYREAMRALVGWSVVDRLKTINCPVLVVAADEDYSPVAAKETFVAKMPDARLEIIEDSRHATAVEHPQQFNAIVAAFFEETSG
jgi:pimeloyl-ACP methyl ester carboxylesterase